MGDGRGGAAPAQPELSPSVELVQALIAMSETPSRFQTRGLGRGL